MRTRPHTVKTRIQLVFAVLSLALLGTAAGYAENKVFRGAELRGSFTQGGLLIGKTAQQSRVFFDGKTVRVSSDGDFLIGFGRDAKLDWTLVIEQPDGQRFENAISINPRDYDIQRIEGLPQKMVTPPEEVLTRIREDTRLVREARRTDDARTDFLEPIDWPVVGIITGVYGAQRVLNGEPRRPHYGIDIHAPTGTPVKAPASGIVTMAHQDMYFSGATLIIDHGHGLSSTFLHLEQILVEPGEYVAKNQTVATVGSSGRSTGPHLDWRLNLFSARLDPQLIAGEMPAPE